MFEQRYSILSSIISIVVGFCVLIFIMLIIFKHIFLEAIHFLVNLLLSTDVLNDKHGFFIGSKVMCVNYLLILRKFVGRVITSSNFSAYICMYTS